MATGFRFGDGRDWFLEKRFGLFIHWGIYAQGGWQEQEQFRMGVPPREYAKHMHDFNPTAFDPDAWLDLAEAVGMRYLCFTTKHIDGFCMWDTAHTDYTIMHTPYGRDVLAMLAEACHRRGFPLCLYYSVADMHHPNYPSAGRSYERSSPDPDDEPDAEAYLAFVRAQVRELCTRYGEIHGFWWDANVLKHQEPAVNEMIRELQPTAVINNRGFDEGDFSTPERDWDDSVNTLEAFAKPTEACQSVGVQSWGYRSNEDFYTERHLIASLDKVLAKGGNYLLNVGPDASGVIPPESRGMLLTVGDWYHRVEEAFDRVRPAGGLIDNRDVLLTRRGNTLYVHLNAVPASNAVLLKPLQTLPLRAVLLNTGRPVDARVETLPWCWKDGKAFLRLANLPVDDLARTVPVVRLDFAALPDGVENS